MSTVSSDTISIVALVSNRLSDAGYGSAGNCYEVSLAAGILIAKDFDKVVRLVKGSVGEVGHWWLLVDGVVVDPTADQFDVEPVYQQEYLHPVDLGEVAILLGV